MFPLHQWIVTFLEGGLRSEVHGEIDFEFGFGRSIGPEFGLVGLFLDFEMGAVDFEEPVDDFVDIFFHFAGQDSMDSFVEEDQGLVVVDEEPEDQQID